jgi:hypothetical protein
VPKLPAPPSVAALRAIERDTVRLARGTALARVYFTAGPHPARWNQFRRYGPTNARFDHHVPDVRGRPVAQDRTILYCATNAVTCFAEVFQETRRIDRVRKAPWLAVFRLERDLELLDLTGAYATRAGASMAINSGNRVRARAWASAWYEAFPDLHGIRYASSMNANEPAIALTDRAAKLAPLPAHPEFNRPLADDALLDVLKHAAARLGYGLL